MSLACLLFCITRIALVQEDDGKQQAKIAS